MADRAWTPKQREAIKTVGRNVLVSAAAGSGKTSVLAERCAYLVCDAPPPHRCDVNELLVVTFTEAAAAEMRGRIAQALAARVEKNPDDARLARQLALVDRAQISTIHAFCLATIRLHFHALGIDPNFSMLSEEEGTLLRAETARDLFADRYESDSTGAFQRFVDRYGDGNDAPLRHRVIRTHDLLGSLVAPDAWLANAKKTLDDAAAAKDLMKSDLGKALNDIIENELASLSRRASAAAEQVPAYAELKAQPSFADEVVDAVSRWADAYRKGGADRLAEVAAAQVWAKMPALRKDVEGAPRVIRDELEAIRDELKCGRIFDLARFNSAQWRESVRRILEPSRVLFDLVTEFSKRYAQGKRELRTLDFTDLERMALRVLAQSESDGTLAPTPAALEYRRQFAHVLVDEYQDVNELQDTLLSLVSRDERFFCVGDVKQSIYRFRLAEPKRFMERYDAYRNGSPDAAGIIVDLQTNFRSRGPLLRALNDVFQRLMTRSAAEIDYDEAQHLHPPAESPYDEHPNDTPHVELHLLSKQPGSSAAADNDDDAVEPQDNVESADFDRTEREAALVAQRILQLTGSEGDALEILAKDASGNVAPRPVKYGDIAILLRSMKFKSGQYVDVLRRAGIPVHSDSGSGFFESMEIRDVLSLLKTLDNPRQDIPLAAVLRSPIAAIPRAEDALARVRLAYPALPYHEAVTRYADVNEHDDELSARLRDFLNELRDWRELAHRRPLAEVLWTIYDRSGYLAFCQGLADGEQRVANLVSLHERARQFGTFRRQGLGRFLRFIDQLREESDLGLPPVASEADDVVRIMSVHRSKGLEFPVVIVPDLGKQHNLSDSRSSIVIDRAAGIGMSTCDEERRVRYPSLASVVVSEQLKKQMLAEEMRVLYVATTRAKEKLILVGTCKSDVQETWTRRWGDHEGPLPADAILRGNCMLDWIGPAWAAINGGRSRVKPGAKIELHVHDSIDVENIAAKSRQVELTPRERALASLQPLSPPPRGDDAKADTIWRRLSRPYRFDALTRVKASSSVTATTKKAPREAIEADAIRAAQHDRADGFMFDEGLRTPHSVTGARSITAADVGAATHTLFEHLDYENEDLASQLERLVEGRLVSPEAAKQVDLASIEWFVKSELGVLFRAHAKHLRREFSINFPYPADNKQESDDPMDRVMMRGRLDVLLPMRDGGAVIADFKTDDVRQEARLRERIEIYSSQLRHYANAIARLTNRPVARACVVMLKSRTIHDVEI